MPDDMTDAEERMTLLQGVENHPHGFILIRLFRLVKTAAARLKALEDRVSRLEGK